MGELEGGGMSVGLAAGTSGVPELEQAAKSSETAAREIIMR